MLPKGRTAYCSGPIATKVSWTDSSRRKPEGFHNPSPPWGNTAVMEAVMEAIMEAICPAKKPAYDAAVNP